MSSEPVLVHRVIARLNVGGPAMHVVHLTRAMNAGPWRTRLVAGSVTEDEGDMTYFAEERGVEVTELPALDRRIRPLADLATLGRLWRLFRRDRPAVVHTHTAKAGTLGRLAAFLAGVPVRIHTFHGHVLGGDYFSPAKTRFFLAVERLLARLSSRLVVLTEVQAREMSEELALAPRTRFAVVPLGLDLERFRAVDRRREGAEARRELGLADDEAAVAIVGRLVPIKNHELFLEALAVLRGEGGTGRPGDSPNPGEVASGESPNSRTAASADPPNSRNAASAESPNSRTAASAAAPPRPRPVRGVVVGSGEREAELRRYAAGLGLADDAVLWLGWRRDLPRLSAAFDLVALTSHDEGTPVALLEALAAGTRVVAREVGGVGEVLRDAGGGRLVPEDEGPEGWAAALAAELDAAEGGWAAGLPDAVRDRVTERYSVARLVDDLAALYREELART